MPALALLSVLASALPAQSNIELLHTSLAAMSAPWEVAVYQNHAYAVGAGYSLYIIDLGDPTHPQFAGLFNTPTDPQTRDIEIVGSLALLFHQNRISFVDLSDPVQPELLGSLPFSGNYAYHATLSNLVLVSTSSGNLYCFDFINPADPVQTDMINCGFSYPSLGVIGNQAWAAGSSAGIRVLDISDPYDLNLGAGIPYTEYEVIKATHGNLLFASHYTEARIYEAGNGGSLNLLSTIQVGADYMHKMKAGDGFVILDYDVVMGQWSSSYYRIYGLSDPAQPVQLYGSSYGDDYGASLSYSEGFLFLIPGDELMICTLGAGGSPLLYQGVFRQNGGRWIKVNGTHAFVGSGSSISCLANYTSPQPTVLSSISLPDLTAMAVSENLLLTTSTSHDEMGWPDSPPHLRIFDVNNPASPQFIYSDDIPCWYQECRNISVSFSRAWFAVGYEGVWYCDLSNPANPTLQAVLDNNSVSFDYVHAYGDYLFCGIYDGNANTYYLRIYEVSNPGNPVLVSSLYLINQLMSVSIWGNKAYLGCNSTLLQAVDISQIANPSPCGYIQLSGHILDLAARQDYVAVATLTGLRVVKVNANGSLSLAGYYDFPSNSYGYDLILSDELALAAQGGWLGVYDIGAAIAVCGSDDPEYQVPPAIALSCHPNPSSAGTTLSIAIPRGSEAEVSVYNLKGERVRAFPPAFFPEGTSLLEWDGRDDTGQRLPSGIYLMSVKAGSLRGTRRVTMF
jgi:hypothetical protein